MKKYLFLFLGVVIIGLASCSKNDSNDNIPPFDAALQAKVDEQAIKTYLTAHPTITATKDTASGLYYQILAEGTGARPGPDSLVTLEYKGETLKGTVFDAGTFTTLLNNRANIIEGFKIGVPLIKTGGKILLIIPSALAYGNYSPSPVIGMNAVLVFTVTLKSID